MTVLDLTTLTGRTFPARRETKNLVGGASRVHTEQFCMGYVTLAPHGGQVPWHNHPETEVYFIMEGTGQMCVGTECREVHHGQMVYIPPDVYHQLTNTGADPLKMLYCYGPAGDVAHWRQELDGTLPRAGHEAPPLPEGAYPQTV